jgi:hypothetical protein
MKRGCKFGHRQRIQDPKSKIQIGKKYFVVLWFFWFFLGYWILDLGSPHFGIWNYLLSRHVLKDFKYLSLVSLTIDSQVLHFNVTTTLYRTTVNSFPPQAWGFFKRTVLPFEEEFEV